MYILHPSTVRVCIGWVHLLCTFRPALLWLSTRTNSPALGNPSDAFDALTGPPGCAKFRIHDV